MSDYQSVSRRSGQHGDTVITTFNLYNLFPVAASPEEYVGGAATAEALETQLCKLALAIQHELALPEVMVVQEVADEGLLQALADRVNAAADTRYRAAAPPTSDRRGIRVGFVWDEARVALTELYQLVGPEVAAAFGADSANPGREPLVGVFGLHGRSMTIVANHFKSNYIPDELADAESALRQANAGQRQVQARVVRQFANEVLAADPAALLMVAGDLNTDLPQTPDSMHPLRVLAGVPGEVPLRNLVNRVGGTAVYTFKWDTGPAVLDHMLVSPRLWELVTAVNILHFNVDYPPDLAADPMTACRSSDHDPLEVQFRLHET